MQTSFSDLEYAGKKKQTRRERFLTQLDAVTPWAQLEAALAPFYPAGKGPGRPPLGLARMLRMVVAQQCFGLSDEGIEDALYDSRAIRRFVGIDLGREAAPDATTLLKFRRLLETHGLTQVIFETIRDHLARAGLLLREGTIPAFARTDATLIAAPPSTKNRERSRDPDRHQAKKDRQWHFGMKAHIGVDLGSSLVHTVLTTPANVSDVTQAHDLLHGQERVALGDAGYRGVDKRPENANTAVTWHVALRPGARRALPDDDLGQLQRRIERVKAGLRAKVEHPFHIVKNLFRYRKTRYRGLAKNTAQVLTLFGLANLVLASWRLRAQHRIIAS